MAYIDKQTGEKKFSLKEKYAYHKECANTGKKPDGTKLTMTERTNHALAANRTKSKLSNFMNSVQTVERVNAVTGKAKGKNVKTPR